MDLLLNCLGTNIVGKIILKVGDSFERFSQNFIYNSNWIIDGDASLSSVA